MSRVRFPPTVSPCLCLQGEEFVSSQPSSRNTQDNSELFFWIPIIAWMPHFPWTVRPVLRKQCFSLSRHKEISLYILLADVYFLFHYLVLHTCGVLPTCNPFSTGRCFSPKIHTSEKPLPLMLYVLFLQNDYSAGNEVSWKCLFPSFITRVQLDLIVSKNWWL